MNRSISRSRINILDANVANEIINAIKIPKNAIVFDINPGSGMLTHALLQNKNVKKVFSLEPLKHIVSYLQPLKEELQHRYDVFEVDPMLEADFLNKKEDFSDIPISSWEMGHPSLISVSQIPFGKMGDQMISSIISMIYDKWGLQSFGRIPMYLITHSRQAERLLSGEGDNKRSQLNLFAEGLGDMELLQIFKDGFYPKGEYALLDLKPFITPKITVPWQTYQYVVSHLLVKRKGKVEEMIRTLGAGTEKLLKDLSFDSKTLITNLTVEQFNEIAEKYDNWPFKPEVLLYPFDPFYKIVSDSDIKQVLEKKELVDMSHINVKDQECYMR
ncbi:9689_t:CDS:10 [Entrophospora sp. SA101]|nr:9689_t:CDS:10 [Entrophospora sp. SA101]